MQCSIFLKSCVSYVAYSKILSRIEHSTHLDINIFNKTLILNTYIDIIIIIFL
jgi:hypothetical protein